MKRSSSLNYGITMRTQSSFPEAGLYRYAPHTRLRESYTLRYIHSGGLLLKKVHPSDFPLPLVCCFQGLCFQNYFQVEVNRTTKALRCANKSFICLRMYSLDKNFRFVIGCCCSELRSNFTHSILARSLAIIYHLSIFVGFFLL